MVVRPIDSKADGDAGWSLGCPHIDRQVEMTIGKIACPRILD